MVGQSRKHPIWSARDDGGGYSSVPRQMRELLHHPLVDPPLEGHDQVGKILHRLPAPFDEFRDVVAAGGMQGIDLAVFAGEAERKPFLGLAAISAAPGLADAF